jgi:hypothetical protein
MCWEEEKVGLDQMLELFRQVGRLPLCHQCKKLKPEQAFPELDCLTCPEYGIHEVEGNIGKGFALYDNSAIVHLVDNINSDGIYRSGNCFCGLWSNEESNPVEMFCVTDLSGLICNIGEAVVCKQCLAAFKQKYSKM